MASARDHPDNGGARRAPSFARFGNGIADNGDLDVESFQYPGNAAFTEVESQAVRGLAHNQFLTRKVRDEVDGLVCSLSWHTFSLVGHPWRGGQRAS